MACQFIDDFDAGAGTDAGGSCPEHGGGVGEGPNASGSFDSSAGSGYAAKEADIIGGRTASGETGTRLEEVGSGREGKLGGAEFFFEVEEAGFEDDFYDGSGCVGELDYAVNFLTDGLIVGGLPGLQEAYIEDHVDIVSAVAEHVGGLFLLGDREGCAEREADDDADGNAGALEGGGCERDPGGVDHGAREAVFCGFVAELEHLIARSLGFEESVVEDSSEILGGRECVCGESLGVEVF